MALVPLGETAAALLGQMRLGFGDFYFSFRFSKRRSKIRLPRPSVQIPKLPEKYLNFQKLQRAFVQAGCFYRKMMHYANVSENHTCAQAFLSLAAPPP